VILSKEINWSVFSQLQANPINFLFEDQPVGGTFLCSKGKPLAQKPIEPSQVPE